MSVATPTSTTTRRTLLARTAAATAMGAAGIPAVASAAQAAGMPAPSGPSLLDIWHEHERLSPLYSAASDAFDDENEDKYCQLMLDAQERICDTPARTPDDFLGKCALVRDQIRHDPDYWEGHLLNSFLTDLERFFGGARA